MEGALVLQKTAQGHRRLCGHQHNSPWRSDYFNSPSRDEAELLVAPLGNYDLEFRGDSRDIHGKVVI
jgi:hypothetical protein